MSQKLCATEFETLRRHLHQYIQPSEGEWRQICEKFTYREVPERFCLVEHGMVCKEIYFMVQGCARLYYLKDGAEVTGFFFMENMFLNSFQSFLSQAPSVQLIETLEPCRLLCLHHDRVMELYERLPVFNVLMRKVIEERFLFAQGLVGSFIMDSPEERYLKMLERYPQIFQRVPQHMLATYLGITPVSLSRIRRRILDKDKK